MGNVAVRVVGSKVTVISAPGIVGGKLRRLRGYSGSVERGASHSFLRWNLRGLHSIGRGRATNMTERLLRRIVSSKARCVIVDLTGVDAVDTMTANHLIKMILKEGRQACFAHLGRVESSRWRPPTAGT